MTAQQPEYIITEEMVQCIEAWTQRYPEVSKDISAAIRSRPAPAPDDEMADRFTTKYEAWSQGFQDGKIAATVDLNIIERRAARAATLAENKRVIDDAMFRIKSIGMTIPAIEAMVLQVLESLRQRAGEQR